MGYQYKFDIAGTEYEMSDVASAKIEHPLFDKFSVGNTCSAELDITIWEKSDIPKMAKIVPYINVPIAHENIKIVWLGGFSGCPAGTYSIDVPNLGAYAIALPEGAETFTRVTINVTYDGSATATIEWFDWFDMGLETEDGYLPPEPLIIYSAPDNTYPDLLPYACLHETPEEGCDTGNCSENPVNTTVIPVYEDNWKQLGVFWIDTREKVGDRLHILAYDAMMRGNVVWKPRDDLDFNPETGLPMPDAVAEIARMMNIELDDRANEILMLFSYGIDYPANDWTLRDVLGFIGAAYAANWIITAEGKLLLVPLFPESFDTELMVDEDVLVSTEKGEAITLGGVGITV